MTWKSGDRGVCRLGVEFISASKFANGSPVNGDTGLSTEDERGSLILKELRGDGFIDARMGSGSETGSVSCLSHHWHMYMQIMINILHGNTHRVQG